MRNARRIREGLNLTLEEVAARTTIKFSHLSAFEREEAGMGLARLLELAAFYGCTTDQLLATYSEPESVPAGSVVVVVVDSSD